MCKWELEKGGETTWELKQDEKNDSDTWKIEQKNKNKKTAVRGVDIYL